MNVILTTYQGAILGPIARVLGYILQALYALLANFGIGNTGICMILFTFLVNGLMMPMQIKQQKFSKMSMIMNPEIQAIQKKYKNKKDQASQQKMSLETQAVYQKYGVSPASGCLPMLITFPILFALYRVIYNAIEDIEAAMKGMLDPEFEEKVTGHAEVRQIFKASGVGTIAGSYVLDGTIQRDSSARIIRDGIVVHEGKLASIQRGKDAVKEVRTGFECGLVMENFNDIKEGDQIESFIMEEVPR